MLALVVEVPSLRSAFSAASRSAASSDEGMTTALVAANAATSAAADAERADTNEYDEEDDDDEDDDLRPSSSRWPSILAPSCPKTSIPGRSTDRSTDCMNCRSSDSVRLDSPSLLLLVGMTEPSPAPPLRRSRKK